MSKHLFLAAAFTVSGVICVALAIYFYVMRPAIQPSPTLVWKETSIGWRALGFGDKSALKASPRRPICISTADGATVSFMAEVNADGDALCRTPGLTTR